MNAHTLEPVNMGTAVNLLLKEFGIVFGKSEVAQLVGRLDTEVVAFYHTVGLFTSYDFHVIFLFVPLYLVKDEI